MHYQASKGIRKSKLLNPNIKKGFGNKASSMNETPARNNYKYVEITMPESGKQDKLRGNVPYRNELDAWKSGSKQLNSQY